LTDGMTEGARICKEADDKRTMKYRLNPRIKTTIPTHYITSKGIISCGAIIGVSTTNKNKIDCNICLLNIKKKED